ncbi:MAG TPA: ATP-binding cassette domain-containing protein, partial [Flavobacterium sp.]|nr:ATP-binding cassette domain-containing protein [Flavobacterium sp.]
MIEIKNIEKSFGENKVLKGISTIFETGKTNLIIGQSGSGKTVLLKSLLGIHEIDHGVISFDGRIYSEMSPTEKRELRTEIGMVFQGSALFDSMTVDENVGFPLRMFTDKSLSEIQERVNFVLDRVNLDNAHKKKPAELSGGM